MHCGPHQGSCEAPTVRQSTFRMLVLCGVIPGAPYGVPHSGVRFEHRCNCRYRYLGLDTTTHLGHKEWIAVYGGRCTLQLHRRYVVLVVAC